MRELPSHAEKKFAAYDVSAIRKRITFSYREEIGIMPETGAVKRELPSHIEKK